MPRKRLKKSGVRLWRARRRRFDKYKVKIIALMDLHFGDDLKAGAEFISVPRAELGGKPLKSLYSPASILRFYTLLRRYIANIANSVVE
jgi:hypothetical protein